MEKKIVLLEDKYAPTGFDGTWFGNEHVKKLLSEKTLYTIRPMTLVGPPGTGKSAAARILRKTLFDGESHPKFNFNMSTQGNVAFVEEQFTKICEHSSSDPEKRTYVEFTEFDNVSKQAQQGLRKLIEDYHKRVCVVNTCNYVSKVLDPILSRCPPVFFTLADPVTSKAYALRILDGEHLTYEEPRVDALVKAANGKLRDIATLIQLWTTGNELVYQGVGNIKHRIVELFTLLNQQDLNRSLSLVDELARESSDREIVRELALRIRDSRMPDSVKEKAIVTMLETDAALVQGVDMHTALWSMIVKLMIAVRQAKPQAQVKKQ